MSACTGNKETNSLNQLVSQKTNSLKILQNKIDSLRNESIELKEELNEWFTEIEIDKLRAKGIQHPEQEITIDLLNKPNLIPYLGVLGGTMRFGDIKLLGDRWVVAYFADGHIDGEMILRYTITKDLKIKWTVIDHYLN
ncbi:MAG TPA: hypothetical protein PLU11_02290 [Chitinophagaceae bacterium]|nr:hypothetical protein [Chitinophagaceae bacterium]